MGTMWIRVILSDWGWRNCRQMFEYCWPVEYVFNLFSSETHYLHFFMICYHNSHNLAHQHVHVHVGKWLLLCSIMGFICVLCSIMSNDVAFGTYWYWLCFTFALSDYVIWFKLSLFRCNLDVIVSCFFVWNISMLIIGAFYIPWASLIQWNVQFQFASPRKSW